MIDEVQIEAVRDAMTRALATMAPVIRDGAVTLESLRAAKWTIALASHEGGYDVMVTSPAGDGFTLSPVFWDVEATIETPEGRRPQGEHVKALRATPRELPE